MLDLDHFKVINEPSHLLGDELLEAVGNIRKPFSVWLVVWSEEFLCCANAGVCI